MKAVIDLEEFRNFLAGNNYHTYETKRRGVTYFEVFGDLGEVVLSGIFSKEKKLLDYRRVYFHEELIVDGKKFGRDYDVELSVTLRGLDDKPDCQVGNFGYNFYFRTIRGRNRLPYKTEIGMKKAVEATAKRLGLEVKGWKKRS